MKKIDLLLFDLDGTLIDSSYMLYNAIQFVLSHYDLPPDRIDHNTAMSYIGGDASDLFERIFKHYKEFSGLDPVDAVNVFDVFFRENSVEGTKLFPNVLEVLDHFSSKRKAILTNRSIKAANYSLDAFNLKQYFDDVIGSDGNECFKPAPCPINKALGHITAEKERTIMIGDMIVDIQAGKNAGVITCGVTYGLGKKEDIIKENPDYVIDDIIELKDIIQ